MVEGRRTQVLKHISGAGKSKRGRSKGDVRGGATARRAMEKGRCARVIEGKRSKEMTQSNTSHGGRKYLLSPRGVMAVEVSQNDEIIGGEKSGGRKGVGSAIRRRGANRESLHIKK